MYIKTFEDFKSMTTQQLFIANPKADDILESSEILIEKDEMFYIGENIETIVEFLESEGFTSPNDFTVGESLTLDESLSVKYLGVKHGADVKEVNISINGHQYGYSQKEGDIDILEIARKFEKMLKFSAGRALTWLKKHTDLTSGSKSTEASDLKNVE